MPGMRSQGRPIRDAAVGGKEAILHGVRDFIRSNVDSDISRKDIANYLNVTPALISYYFPDRNELLENATAPILKDIADHVDDIVSAGDPPLSILKMMITFYVECHINEGGIIQCFSDLVVKSEHYRGPDYTSAIRNKTKDFINRKFPNDNKSCYKLKSISWNLWSLCRLVIIETPTAPDFHSNENTPETSAVQYADRIYTLLTDGIGLDKFAMPPRS